MEKDDSHILLEMYKMMKSESRVVTQLQQTTLSWSSVSVGVLLLFALNLWKESALLAFGFFVLILPAASIMFFNVWLMEVARVMRIGRYMLLLENKIQKYLLVEKLFMYEHWLREQSKEGNRHFTFGHLSAIAIYMGILVFSHLVATIIFWTFSGSVWISPSISILMHPDFWAVFYGNSYLNVSFVYKLIFTAVIFFMDIVLVIGALKRVRKYVLYK